jgi:hypothetical protein
VYIIFNEPFWEVLNSAPVRPLDRAYMKELPPAARRFYEIVNRKIFAALKNDYPRAKITYSEVLHVLSAASPPRTPACAGSDGESVRHHKKSGYITAVKYEPTMDAQNQPDWIMYLKPGPKALAEFAAAHGDEGLKKELRLCNRNGESPTETTANRTTTRARPVGTSTSANV